MYAWNLFCNMILHCFYSIEKDHLTLQANVRADLVAFLVINEQTAPARNLSVKQVTPGCLLLNFNLQCRWRIDAIPFLFRKQMRGHLKLKQTVQTNSLILVWFNIICLEIWLHKSADFCWYHTICANLCLRILDSESAWCLSYSQANLLIMH